MAVHNHTVALRATAPCERASDYLIGVDPVALTPLHRLLLAERSLRRSLGYELMRVLYYQPLFELQCAEVRGGGRLELTVGSKLPFVDNCALVLGEGWRINAATEFHGARNAPTKARIVIGDGSYLGIRVVLRAGLGIELGKHVTIAANVVLSSDPEHPTARRSEPSPREDLRHMSVGDDVWIAEGAMLLGGITVGEGAVVGAHAVVTDDVPPRTVVAGNPARVVKEIRPPNLRSAG